MKKPLESVKQLYSFFRLEERKFSSNIIEGGNINPEGKMVWVPIFAPLTEKRSGDKFCLDVLDVLIETK